MRGKILLSLFIVFTSFFKCFAIVEGVVSNHVTFANSPLVYIQHKADTMCTGVLISQKTVLTAAHCIFPLDKLSHVLVYVPDNKVTTLGYSIKLLLSEKLIVHPKYSKNFNQLSYDQQLANTKFDIGIIQLKEAVPTIKPIASLKSLTPNLMTEIKDNKLLIMGYGATKVTGTEYAPSMGIGELADNDEFTDVVTEKSITEAFKTTEQEALTLDKSMGASMCYGDSGGGIFFVKSSENINLNKPVLPKKWELLAINSWVLDSKFSSTDCQIGSVHPTVFAPELNKFIISNTL